VKKGSKMQKMQSKLSMIKEENETPHAGARKSNFLKSSLVQRSQILVEDAETKQIVADEKRESQNQLFKKLKSQEFDDPQGIHPQKTFSNSIDSGVFRD